MKITRSQLREIIREEMGLGRRINEDLDPKADSAHKEYLLNYLAKTYSYFKPKRLDDSNLKKDVITLLSKNLPYNKFYTEFFELYSLVTTRSDWRGGQNNIMDTLRYLWKQDQSIRQGDTSMYGYRVFAKRKESNK